MLSLAAGQYDQDRDKLNAGNEAGVIDAGKGEKPPPTCVDVEIGLDELFRGCYR